MGVDELKGYLEEIKDSIRNKTYKPELVRRVEIPKPDGGVQNLGVPTVLDRFDSTSHSPSINTYLRINI